MKYKQLSSEERYHISVEHKAGTSANMIGKFPERSQSSISRELKRNKGQRGYRHNQAHNLAHMRHINKPKKVKLSASVKATIDFLLSHDWSPEQIAGRLKLYGVISLHHETIYRYILADKKNSGNLYTHLRHQNKRYRKRYGNANNRSGILK